MFVYHHVIIMIIYLQPISKGGANRALYGDKHRFKYLYTTPSLANAGLTRPYPHSIRGFNRFFARWSAPIVWGVMATGCES